MVKFDDLIKYENENTALDFKAVQYEKKHYEALIKDIMSMANADIENDRHIIVGIKHKPGGGREILGIEKDNFIDPATYQQVIRENIEPEINLDYFPYEFEGKLVGIFKISKCFDKPYMMKKDFKDLKKGNCFIRKGNHQYRMERRDFERIVQNRIRNGKFDGIVNIGFYSHNFAKEIELKTAGEIKLPPRRAAEKIKKIINEKKLLGEKEAQPNKLGGFSAFMEMQRQRLENLSRFTFDPFAPIPYEQRSLEELANDLKEIEKTYRDQDYYEFFELDSHKINISILNHGDRYIEDASIELEVHKTDGLFVADRVYEEPEDPTARLRRFALPTYASYDSMNYPKVDYLKSSIVVKDTIGDVKHHISTNALKVPIRIVFLDKLAGRVIDLKCKIFGKNLTGPLKEILRIKLISAVKKKS